MTELDPFRPGQTDETGRPICGARKRNGDPCGASPKRGAKRCARHGSGNRQSKAAAAKTVTDEKAGKALRSLGYDPGAENVDPSEALLRLVSDKAREVAWLRHMVDQINADQDPIDRHTLTWGVDSHEQGMEPEGPIDKTTERVGINVWIGWLHTAEDQLARYATAALRAGVEQRQVEIREAEALVFVGAIHQILGNLQLTAEQQRLVPTVVPQALRAIERNAA
ncbi:MAG: hypothetical protein QJR09_08135 [Micrococcus sp.]|nr:hypothetical protein [Micrococcus sp.]